MKLAPTRLKRLATLFLFVSALLLGLPPDRLDVNAVPPAGDPEPNGWKVELVSATAEQVVLDVYVDGFDSAPVVAEGMTYQRLRLSEAGTTGEIGKPELPVVGQLVAIPPGARVRVETVDREESTLTGYTVYPAQMPQPDQQGVDPPFAIDRVSYEQDAFYPRERATVSTSQTMRDLTVVRLSVYPLRFNPARNEFRFATYMRIRLTFEGGTNVSASNEEALTGDSFHDLCRRFVVNCDAAEHSLRSDGVHTTATTGAEYLIVSAPGYVSAANVLAEWKNRRGIRTVVRTTNDTGGPVADFIKNYIQMAYNTWNPRPSYVLLLGDADTIPVHYVTTHPAAGSGPEDPYPEGHKTGTDLYYATMGGSGDVLPDLHLGRIPVDSLAEANHVVSKIIAYESNPTSDAGFYGRMAMVAQFQDDDPRDGREDRLFTRTSEEIRAYLASQGYDVERIYTADAAVTPLWYNDGTPIPGALLRPGFAWNSTLLDIWSAINDGVLVLNHRDHGWAGGWAHPYFPMETIAFLNNGAEMPVVFSINCETGWFDAETDGYGESGYDPGFAERFLRHGSSGQGGAVGVFAATRLSYSWRNDFLIKGFYDSIWPGFLPFGAAAPSPRVGDALTFGKIYFDMTYGHSNIYSLTTLEIFHYLGDPTMEIWTEAPSSLSVSHPATAKDGDSLFAVTGAPNGALVSIVQDGEILGTATSVGGLATVTLDPPLDRGTAHVTVTKHNYRPYQGTVSVLPRIPFYDGFESASLLPGWSLYLTNEGRVQVAQGDAHSGAYSVLLDDAANNTTYSHAAIILTLDLSGTPNVNLGFWWREFTDENHADDGVFFSDDGGSSWSLTENFGDSSGYQHEVIDVDQEATIHGLVLNDHFRIKFQFYDNYSIANDGYSIDDVTVDTDPATPTNLQVSALSPNQLDLSWIDNSDEDGFVVERSANGTSGWVPVGTVGADTSTYLDTGLPCNTQYYYRVRAYRGGDYSAYSNVDHAATRPYTTYLPAIMRNR